MATEVFYVGKDNASRLLLKLDDVAQNITSFTKAEIRFNGITYSSTDFADAFDWATEGADGILILQAGLISSIIAAARDVATELIVYDPQNTNGIVWDTFDLDMKLLTEE